jgi:hypothetical protein
VADDRDRLVRLVLAQHVALEHVLTRPGAIALLRNELRSSRPGRPRAVLYALSHLDAIEVDEATAGWQMTPTLTSGSH